jgi:ubiquitin C-terminal hydrolase
MENKGLCGLKNFGNTCFINSAIQCLSNTEDFTKYVLSNKFVLDINNNNNNKALCLAYKQLINAIWNNNGVITPITFHRVLNLLCIRNKLQINFGNFGQNDVQEFIEFILSTMHDILSKEVNINISGNIKNDLDKIAYDSMKSWKQFFKNSYSKIIEMFYGQIIYTTIDKNDNTNIISREFQPNCFFTLPIPKNNCSLYDCWDLYTSDEEFVFNDKDCLRNIKAWSLPNNLIICLNRFRNNLSKNNSIVDFPLENLNLEKYIIGYEKPKSIYNLYGICAHSGSVHGGHYTSYCKHINGNWYHYNDEKIYQINNINTIVNNRAYILFYKKV